MNDAPSSERAKLLRIAQASGIAGCLILAAGFAYMLEAGIGGAARAFHRLQAVAIPLFVIAAIYGMRYSAVAWRDRPEKQQRFRAIRLLILLLLVLSIPAMIMDWLYS